MDIMKIARERSSLYMEKQLEKAFADMKASKKKTAVTPGAKARSHKYYEEHAEELKAYRREYYKNHCDEIKAYQREYYKTHAEEVKASVTKCRKKEKEEKC